MAGPARSRPALAVAVVLAVAAVALPPSAVAAAVAGPERVAVVARGLWIFKGLLLAHAVVLAALAWHPVAIGGAPLAGPRPAADGPAPPLGWPALVVLVLGLGLVLRVIGLGEGLWHDEIHTLMEYGRASLGDVLTRFDSKNQHPLYSVLANLSLGLFGDGARALRLPAMVFGVGSLWATYDLGRRLTARREAILAALLLATSYQHVWFSQNARGYTVLLFFTLTATSAFLDLLRAEGSAAGATLRYAGSMALATWTHATAAMTGAAHAVIWAVLLVRRRTSAGSAAWLPGAAVLLSGTLTLLLYGPMLPQFLRVISAPTMPGADVVWKSPLWFVAELVRGLSQGSPVMLAVLGAGALVGLVGLGSYVRRGLLEAAVLVLPGLAIVVPLMVLEQNLWPRFFFFCAGFAMLIGVRGLVAAAGAAAGRRGPALATAVVLVAAAGSAWTARHAWAPKQDYAGAVAFVDSARGPADAVVPVDLAAFGVRDYQGRADWEPVESAAALDSVARAHPRTWVLYTFPIRMAARHADILSRLAAAYDTAAVLRGTVSGGDIVVMTTPRRAPADQRPPETP